MKQNRKKIIKIGHHKKIVRSKGPKKKKNLGIWMFFKQKKQRERPSRNKKKRKILLNK
jgi:hypothetical protein